MCAAAKGHLEALALLLRLGSDPTMVDINGKTALRLAFDNEHFEIVRYLVRKGIKN